MARCCCGAVLAKLARNQPLAWVGSVPFLELERAVTARYLPGGTLLQDFSSAADHCGLQLARIQEAACTAGAGKLMLGSQLEMGESVHAVQVRGWSRS